MSLNDKENNLKNMSRICHVIKREGFEGYGFNLHAERGKPGQYIGKVDDGSPAAIAGLREGDRIIEVNSTNIGNETHKQVVQRIKTMANEVRLLVVDPCVEVTKDNQIVNNKDNLTTTAVTTTVTDNNNIEKTDEIINKNNNDITTTATKTTTETITEDDTIIIEDTVMPIVTPIPSSPNNSIKTEKNIINKNLLEKSEQLNEDEEIITTKKSSNENGKIITETNGNLIKTNTIVPLSVVTSSVAAPAITTTTTTTTATTTTTTQQTNDIHNKVHTNDNNNQSKDVLKLPMTVAEMRAQLAAKKKKDPKNSSVGLRQKFEIIEKL